MSTTRTSDACAAYPSGLHLQTSHTTSKHRLESGCACTHNTSLSPISPPNTLRLRSRGLHILLLFADSRPPDRQCLHRRPDCHTARRAVQPLRRESPESRHRYALVRLFSGYGRGSDDSTKDLDNTRTSVSLGEEATPYALDDFQNDTHRRRRDVEGEMAIEQTTSEGRARRARRRRARRGRTPSRVPTRESRSDIEPLPAAWCVY